MSERRYAVLIGSSQFPEEPKLLPLRAPENDVDGLYDILMPKDLGNFTEISVLKNKSSHEAEIAILSVLTQAEKNDLVVIYYSGHGKLDSAGRLHLAMANTRLNVLGATSIPVTRIRDFVDNSPSNKVVLILDCCYSGAAGGLFARGALDEQLQLASGGRGTYIMTASTAIQIAQERQNDQYGLFTKKIIEGIRSGKADLNEDGNVTMDELYSYVHREMLDEGFQEPMKWDLNVRGELVIARTGKSPRQERRKAIRRKLLDLEGQDLLPHRVLIEALEFLNRPSSEGSAADRQCDALLSQLLEGRLRVGDFIGGWYEISKPSRERKDLNWEGTAEIRPGKTSASFREAEAVDGPAADAKPNTAPDTGTEVTGATTQRSPSLPKEKASLSAWSRTVLGATGVGLLWALISLVQFQISRDSLKSRTAYPPWTSAVVWIAAWFFAGLVLALALRRVERRIPRQWLVAIALVWPIVLGISLHIGVDLTPSGGYGTAQYYFDVVQRFTESPGYIVACAAAGALTGLFLGISKGKRSIGAWFGTLSFAVSSVLGLALISYLEPGKFPLEVPVVHSFVLGAIGASALLWLSRSP
ncbi:MAG: caspase family protein [Candidatus Sulfotelmatobacter sp.]